MSRLNDKAIVCENCGAEHEPLSVKIRVSQIDIMGQTMKVTWMFCQSCESVFVISIEDAKSYDLKVKYDALTRRLSNAIKSRKDKDTIRELQTRTSGKLKALVSRSDAILNFLKDKGSFTLVATENNFEDICFVPRHSADERK